MNKIKVLFVCIHNSGRSQIAEAYLKQLGKEIFEVESAGLEPGSLNPLVVSIMKEEGIDISKNSTKSVFDFIKQTRFFNYVITVCDETSGERCPIFPGMVVREHWSFDDPSAVEGTDEEKLAAMRIIRDKIKNQIKEFINEINKEIY